MSTSKTKIFISDTPFIDEWDFDENTLNPSVTSASSKEKAWWKCSNCGGKYETSINLKTIRGIKCPYCTGNRALPGFNDLLTKYPEICKEWDYNKNAIQPSEVMPGSGKKAWWICSKCHGSYETQILSRTGGHGCPFCRGIKVLKGYNDLQTLRPDVAKYWDSKKNNLKPDEVTIGTHKKYYWKCDNCDYAWRDSVNHQVHKKGCPACKIGKSDRCGIRAATKDNCLSTTNPEVLTSWDYSKNTIKPEEVTSGSGKIVYWHCDKCHTEYQKKIGEQVRYGCSYCNGKYPIKGKNDLATLYPDVAKEWNYEKNGDLTPDCVTAMNTRKVWWKCSSCGREWQAYIENRTRDNNGCPSCQARTHTSFPEQAVFYYINKALPDTLNGYRDIFDTRMELDVYIPSRKIAIEYDGKAWHKNKSDVQRDINKYNICKKHGIKLIRLAEGNDAIEHCDEIIKCDYKAFHYKELDDAIKKLSKILDIKIDIDSHRDEKIILQSYLGRLEKESIKELYPEKCKYWDYANNGTLKPSMFKPTSGVRVSWLCSSCGKNYERKIGEQIRGLGLCAKCTKKETSKRLHETKLRENGSLIDKYPEIAKSWDYEKNGKLTPHDVTAHSSQRIWWKCNNPECNHSWITSVSNRTGGDRTGCPKCHQGGQDK